MKPINEIQWTPYRRKNKHNAKKTRVDNITFDSKKEAKYYSHLKALRKNGEVLHFHRQVIFDLPGGTKYRCDFQVFYKEGVVRYIDVKGRRLKSYIKAKKQVEALYPVTITEV